MSAYDKTSIQINRCKRILALVDDYVEKQDAATRTDLRKALMKEFEAPSIAPPVAAGSVDTTEFKRLCNALYLANPQLREGERLRMVANINAWGAEQREAGRMSEMQSTMSMLQTYADRAEKAEAEADGLFHRVNAANGHLAIAEARVKELETEIVRIQVQANDWVLSRGQEILRLNALVNEMEPSNRPCTAG